MTFGCVMVFSHFYMDSTLVLQGVADVQNFRISTNRSIHDKNTIIGMLSLCWIHVRYSSFFGDVTKPISTIVHQIPAAANNDVPSSIIRILDFFHVGDSILA